MLAAKTLINPSPSLKLPNNLSLRRKPPFSLSIRNSLSQSPSSPDPTPGQLRVDILAESLPFIQKFRGKTIVVKYGGAAMKSESLQASVVNDLVLLSCVGLRPILVHGGGPEINLLLRRLGIEATFVDGLRVTDAKTMEVVSMVLVGKVNKNLVSLIDRAGAKAIGLCGMDGRLVTARPVPNAAKLGFVGEVARVDPAVLRSNVEAGYIPVIASVAADETGQQYNINADTVAGELAAAVGAEKLILLTDVAGILEDRNDVSSLVKEIDINGVKKMVAEGKIGGGMIPKDGLQKLLGLLNDAASVRSRVNSGALGLPSSESLRNGRSPAEVLTSSEKQKAFRTCVALRQYFRAHLIMLVDPNKNTPSAAQNLPSVRSAFKPLDIGDEAVDAVFLQLQKDRKLGPAFVRTHWPAVDKLWVLMDLLLCWSYDRLHLLSVIYTITSICIGCSAFCCIGP
ncbi:hypothetical protein ACFX2I_043534 [Malus domestica]